MNNIINKTIMKKIYLLTALLTVILLEATAYNKHKSKTEANEYFNLYGQYDEKYITYNDEQMLDECDRHNLIYDFEAGECMSEEEWSELYDPQHQL